MLAQREGIAFVQLMCFACQTQTLALVTGAPEGEVKGRRGRVEPAAISETDVAQMRDFLAGYEGDIGGLFKAARQHDWEPRDRDTDEPK